MTGELKEAPKIFKETCQINWNQPAEQIHNFIRGLSPYPTAWTTLQGKNLKVFKSEIKPGSNQNLTPGEVETDHKTYLAFQTADGLLAITDLQLEGKKRMQIADFLRGFKLV